MAILQPTNTSPAKPSYEELAAKVAALEAAAVRKITLKVSEKGALSLYGMGRFPTTLYASQWERILDMAPQIRAFISANNGKLTRKE